MTEGMGAGFPHIEWRAFESTLLNAEQSYFYHKYSSDLRERLSYNENHPERDLFLKYLEESSNKTHYNSSSIGQLTDAIDDAIIPKDVGPEESYLYLGLENIESNTGRASFKPTRGGEILSSSKVLKKGNIVYSGLRPYLNKASLIDVEEAIGSSELFVIRPHDDVVPEYILLYLLSNLTLIQNKWVLTGSSYPRLNGNDFKNLKVLIPHEKGDQQDIVDKVYPRLREAINKKDQADELIGKSYYKMNEELALPDPGPSVEFSHRSGKENGSNYYIYFLGGGIDRLHFLFNHPRMEAIEHLNQKYTTVQLSSICREPIHRGEQPDYSTIGIQVIKTANLKNKYIDLVEAEFVTEEFYDQKPNAHISKNDILVSSTGYVSMGKVDVYDTEEKAFADGHISVVRVNEEYDPYFVAYFLRSPLGQIQIEKRFSGSSGQIELQPVDLGKTLIPSIDSISLEKQRYISGVVTAAIHGAIVLEKEANDLNKEALRTFEMLALNGP